MNIYRPCVCVYMYEYKQDKVYTNEYTLKIMLITYCN